MIVQLAHCGAKASPDYGNSPLAPSEFQVSENQRAKSMTKKDIEHVVEGFARAAEVCQAAGADGIEIHGAHGYLLSQFLSPYYNKRTDEYGGNISNRSKIVRDVYTAIRKKVGEAYPIWIKLNGEDYVEGGLTFEECLSVCRDLDQLGINGIEVSGGINESFESLSASVMSGKTEEGVFAQNAVKIANEVKMSVIGVGCYRTPDKIETWLNRGNIQAVGLCRPIICEPNLPKIWESGDLRRSKCISCNKCFDLKSGFGCKVF